MMNFRTSNLYGEYSTICDQIIGPLSLAYFGIISYQWRGVLEQILKLLTYLFNILMIWKCLTLITGSIHPIFVLNTYGDVTISRGDVLILCKPKQFDVGDLVVFDLDRSVALAIVHRVIQSHTSPNGEQRLLTKGDNNQVDDAYGIYKPGQMWLTQQDIIGKVTFHIPQAGFIFLIKPLSRYIIIGAVCVHRLFFDHRKICDLNKLFMLLCVSSLCWLLFVKHKSIIDCNYFLFHVHIRKKKKK
eukprot:298457_1